MHSKELILSHSDFIEKTTGKFCKRNRIESEDLAQQVMERLLELDVEVKDPKKWLFTLIKRMFINEYKEKKKKLEGGIDNTKFDEDVLLREKINQSLETLSKEEKDVCQKILVEELTLRACAKSLNLSIDKVRWILNTGKKKLRKELRNEYEACL